MTAGSSFESCLFLDPAVKPRDDAIYSPMIFTSTRFLR
ncbi:MAG: palindromic element RPE4 domain-containing protein [Gammaproteobacteria bacterium]